MKDEEAAPSEPESNESSKKSPEVLEPLVELGEEEDDGDDPDEAEKNVISILPHDDPGLLDNDDSSNSMSDDHHLMPEVEDVEDLNGAGLFQVKEEMCEVKLEESEEAALYSCSSCGLSFSSVLDHIKEYHDSRKLVLEGRGRNSES